MAVSNNKQPLCEKGGGEIESVMEREKETLTPRQKCVCTCVGVLRCEPLSLGSFPELTVKSVPMKTCC